MMFGFPRWIPELEEEAQYPPRLLVVNTLLETDCH